MPFYSSFQKLGGFMFDRKISVAVFSKNITIVKMLINYIETKPFINEVAVRSEIDYDIINYYNILIFDIDLFAGEREKILNEKNENNYIIVVCDKINTTELQSETFVDKVEYFWELPLNFNVLENNFSRIQKAYNLTEENKLLRNYLNVVTNGITDLVWFKDLDGNNFIVNDSFCEAAGKEKKDIVGKDDFYIWDIDPHLAENNEFDCANTDKIVITTKKPYVSNEIMNLRDGSHVFTTYKSPIIDELNEVIGTFGIAKDVTNFQNIERELKIFIETLPFPILFTDQNNKITSANNCFAKLFQASITQIVGKDISSSIEESKELKKLKCKTKTVDDKNLLIISEKIFKITKNYIKDVFDNLSGYVYIFIDYTLDYNYEKELLRIANTDQLTGLKNRHALNGFFGKHKKYQNIVLLSFDLDNFKLVNDTLGHKAGDELLSNFSQLLLETLEGYEVFRLGGDEFVAVTFNNENDETINNHVNKVIKKFKDYSEKVLPKQNLSVSIGVAKAHKVEKLKYEELMHRADVALYDAKRKGKNQVSYWKQAKLQKKVNA